VKSEGQWPAELKAQINLVVPEPSNEWHSQLETPAQNCQLGNCRIEFSTSRNLCKHATQANRGKQAAYEIKDNWQSSATCLIGQLSPV